MKIAIRMLVFAGLLVAGILWADQSKWPWNSGGPADCSHFLNPFSV